MDKEYWMNYYKVHNAPGQPSLFAKFVCEEYLSSGGSLLELGCGNGRDSVFFSGKGLSVLAVDQVESEIIFLNNTYAHEGLAFSAGDFTRLDIEGSFDCVYSRFTLHSVPEEDERRVLKWAYGHLNDGGLFCIEVRSVNDPKLQGGEQVSDNENIVDGHYRRYFDLKNFRARLMDRGFTVLYAEEKSGFAPFGDEDPPVVRVIAQR